MAEILVSDQCERRPPLLIGGRFRLRRAERRAENFADWRIVGTAKLVFSVVFNNKNKLERTGVHPFSETPKLGRGWTNCGRRRFGKTKPTEKVEVDEAGRLGQHRAGRDVNLAHGVFDQRLWGAGERIAMRHLRTVYFAALAIVLSLAATGNASAQAVNYGSQTTASVTVFYLNLPANTQLFLRNEVNGVEHMAAVPPVSGTGSAVVPFNVLPPGPGDYTVMARQSGLWVAQSVMFYLFI